MTDLPIKAMALALVTFVALIGLLRWAVDTHPAPRDPVAQQLRQEAGQWRVLAEQIEQPTGDQP